MLTDKRKIAGQCYAKATEAMNKQNWDYAVDMFGKCVELVPDNVMYRQVLRGTERKKYGDNKTGARMAQVKLMGIRGRIKKARSKEEWPELDRAAEEGLAVNPWDAQFNADVAEACGKQGFLEVAVFGMQTAVENAPDNKDYLRRLAELHEERGNFDEASKHWDRIHKLDPYDADARKRAVDAQAAKMMHRVDDATSARDVRRTDLPPQNTAYDLDRPIRGRPREAAAPGESVEADLQHAIRKDPADVANYQKLAAWYRDERRLEDAEKMLKHALDASGGNPSVREELEDVEIERLQLNLEVAKGKATRGGDDPAVQKAVAGLAKELLQRRIEVLTARVERHPNEMRLKYDLARLHMRRQSFTEAIQLLQRASGDARLQTEVLLALGKCFVAVKNNMLAERQFEKAVELLDPITQRDLVTETRYLLGRLAEEGQRPDQAETHYNEVLALDYAYKDAHARLEKVQKRDRT